MGSVFFNPHREGKSECDDYTYRTNCPGEPQPDDVSAFEGEEAGDGHAACPRSQRKPYSLLLLVISAGDPVRSGPRTAHPPGLVYVLAPLRKAATAAGAADTELLAVVSWWSRTRRTQAARTGGRQRTGQRSSPAGLRLVRRLFRRRVSDRGSASGRQRWLARTVERTSRSA